MKITNITTQVKQIELKTPFKTALRETSHVEFVRVFVEDDAGNVGIGEAPATKAITGEDIEIILESVQSVKESFLTLTCKEALEFLHTSCKIGSSAKAALDMAFISLHLKETNQTMASYFGIKNLTPIKTDVTISLNSVDAMMQDAKKAYEEGKYILKVKVGSDVLHAVDIVRRIAKELPSCEILVDANQAWNFESTLLFIKNMFDLKVELIEQPVVAADLDTLKKITHFSSIPILADEAVFNLEDVKKVMESQSANMINIKLMKCGGVTKAIEILEYARQNNITCMLGSMLEGPYSINIALYLAFAYRDVVRYVDLDSPLLYKEPSSELDFIFSGCEILFKN
ncbi:dipeptide epimerase [Sulfurimonas sp.]|jgi:L-alanine-DL-glutamate epimerase-like enolase superfamily enzyme|uniref:dipeptide epimerase n=1 Tax=Sulfurimonas sp. TaxID=2022749 RepID=UPI0025DAA003|nr:dipeptide epimerase [Sulfurimonas sp.]MCK9473216.1 dipeptide epimerase [Sulfurimonas sp.]